MVKFRVNLLPSAKGGWYEFSANRYQVEDGFVCFYDGKSQYPIKSFNVNCVESILEL